MKNKFSINHLTLAFASLLLAVIFTSCTTSAKKEGEIVKDKNGKYYQLTNERVFGEERYRLIEIDTAIFKRF